MTSIFKNILALTASAFILAFSVGCSGAKEVRKSEPGRIQLPTIGSEPQAMPAAVIYMVNTPGHADRVPITLTSDGENVLSYPDPADLTDAQKPVDLGGGWWLDRRGLSPHSVFTTYSYEQYAALEHAPEIATLLSRIDHNLRITRMIVLPVTAAEAASDTALVRKFIEQNMQGGREIDLSR